MSKDNLQFFIYCRKSSEDNRQAASIGDQLRELKELADKEDLPLADEPFTEEKSAKAPGRPVFQEVLSRIEDGEANALLCWNIDRLYRNPVDGGRVRWLLQNGVLREIRTPFRRFQPQDAGLLMGVEGGRAVEHIITLRKGVLRGFRGKLEKGWRPGPAPPGYVNDTEKEKGKRTISPDPERFGLIRRAWDLMLTGNCSVREIQTIADEEWGLRSRKTEKQGGKPYSVSKWYRIFTMPFYYGKFRFKEPGTDEYRLYEGAHEPMITKQEFERVQYLLGRKDRSPRSDQDFPFTGIMHCGECGASITAERKYQVICSDCGTKFSAVNRDACRECGVPIDDMEDPTELHYIYYRCTKQKDPDCSQPYVRAEDLEEQIREVLARVSISKRFKDWALQALEDDAERDDEAAANESEALQRRKQEIEQQLEHLTDLALSPDTDWDLISKEELKERKAALQEELHDVEQELENRKERDARSLELTERTFHLAAHARFWFREGGPDRQRQILTGLASNMELVDENLELELKKPFRVIRDLGDEVPAVKPEFEPGGSGSTKQKTPSFRSELPKMRRAWNELRTWWKVHLDFNPPPVFGLGKDDAEDSD